MEKKNNQFYQGAPISCLVFFRGDDGDGLASLAGLTLEFAMYDSRRTVKHSWKTSNGTVTIGTVTESGKTRGYASFGLTGAQTALLEPDMYSIEIANVIDNGRGPGTCKQCIEIIPSVIKNGIQQ